MAIFQEDCLEPQETEIPECTMLSNPQEVTAGFLKRAPDSVLFYMFYNLPLDRQQTDAAMMLGERGWIYNPNDVRFYKDLSKAPGGSKNTTNKN